MSQSQTENFTLFVVLPDHSTYVCIYPRSEVVDNATKLAPQTKEEPDVEALVDAAGDKIEELVRRYMHYGDPETVLPDLVASTFLLLQNEMTDADFALVDHGVVYHDPALDEMVAVGYEDGESWADAAESATLDCEVRAELGFKVPSPKYQPQSKPTLH